MKMHVLTAAVLATLASGAVFAASEGGDTWSEVQPVQRPTYSVSQSASHVALPEPALDAAFQGSEGGDTWSSVQASRETSGDQLAQRRPAESHADYASLPDGGSEGGDTWSRFVPQRQGEPTGSARLASAPRLEKH